MTASRIARRATLAAVLTLLLPAGAGAQSGDRTVVAEPPRINPIAPAAAADGSVWFGEDGVSRLGRIAPDGTLTEFPVPAGEDEFSEDLRVEAVGADGRVYFVRDFEERVGVLDPATGNVQFPEFGVTSGALTITADGAIWLVGDLVEDRDRAAVVRIAPDGTRRIVTLGRDRTFFAIAPSTLKHGAVILVREDSARLATHVDAAGVAKSIALPPGTEGLATVGSGPAGTYIGLEGILLRLDGDFVARRVPGLRTDLYNFRRGLGLGSDGSIWIPGEPVVRAKPGSLPMRWSTGLTDDPQGIAVTASNDALIAVDETYVDVPVRERLVRITQAGQVFEHVIGTPPVATATVLSGDDADAQAGKLAVGLRNRLRVAVRCSAACTVRLSVRSGRGGRANARRTVALTRAGTRTVTLRRERGAAPRSMRGRYGLFVVHDASTAYLNAGPAQRAGAGRVLPVAPPEDTGDV